MAKKKKVHQRKEESFGYLAKALEKESEKNYRMSLRYKSYGTYSFLSLLVLVIFIGWFMYGRTASDNHSHKKVVYKVKTSQSSQKVVDKSKHYEGNSSPQYGRQTAFSKSITATKEEFKFNWDLAGYEALKVGNNYNTFGTELTKIVAEHGKASRVYQDENSDYLKLVYDGREYGNTDSDRRRIELHFNKNGKEYYLDQKRASSLTDPAFPTVDREEGAANFKWTQEKLDQVVVGDSSTGTGGESYEDVINAAGLPVEAKLNVNEMYTELYLNYIGGDAKNFSKIELHLKKQADGVYRVYAKNGSFSKNLLDND